nr:TIM barrel protein [Microcella alkalica]
MAVSNIAWSSEDEPAVAAALMRLSVTRVEVAPTKVFADPLAVSEKERGRYQKFWADHGISIVAFQSMLFGREGLQLFGEPGSRRELIETLRGFIDLAGSMGVHRLVFGSPKNRVRPPHMSEREAFTIAVDAFSVLGESAFRSGTVLCIEPNPPAYECNFVVNAAQARRLVGAVQSQGFGLHLDAAGLTLAGDDLAAEVVASGDAIQHFHISAPQLGPISAAGVDHRGAARSLKRVGYEGCVSIEMRPVPGSAAVESVEQAVNTARTEYAALFDGRKDSVFSSPSSE